MSTCGGLTTALADARPGDRIVLAAGTYTGPLDLKASGTADLHVVVAPAAGAAVTLTASLTYPSCAANGPAATQ